MEQKRHVMRRKKEMLAFLRQKECRHGTLCTFSKWAAKKSGSIHFCKGAFCTVFFHLTRPNPPRIEKTASDLLYFPFPSLHFAHTFMKKKIAR